MRSVALQGTAGLTISLELSRGKAGDWAIRLAGTWKFEKSVSLIWVDMERLADDPVIEARVDGWFLSSTLEP